MWSVWQASHPLDSRTTDRLPFLHEGHERQRQAPACWPATLQPRWGAPGEDQAPREVRTGKRGSRGPGALTRENTAMTLAIPHARAATEAPNTNLPSVAGSRLTVPLTDGTQVQYANL